MRRVIVGGSTGSGKSTFARALAQRMGVPLIELDAIRHGPNWSETPDDRFRELVGARTIGDAWVVDGNYSIIREVTWGRADTLVWLDYSLRLVLWRLFLRTNRRIFRREILWNGNRERFTDAYLSRESLYVWVLRSFWRRRRNWPRWLAEGYRHLAVHRFRTPGEAQRWLATTFPLPEGVYKEE
jgi:adenylate kinase family enzyme